MADGFGQYDALEGDYKDLNRTSTKLSCYALEVLTSSKISIANFHHAPFKLSVLDLQNSWSSVRLKYCAIINKLLGPYGKIIGRQF